MNIVSLFCNLLKGVCEDFQNNCFEMSFVNTLDSFNVDFLKETLESLDTAFKNSNERKEKYFVKQISTRTVLFSIGYVTYNYTRYTNKETGKSYSFINELLNLKPYQRVTDYAEYALIKFSMENNMSSASKNAIRNTSISRCTVSNKCKKLSGTIHEDIYKSKTTPKVLYIEMDEIHANLQRGGNIICPCAIVHEGHKEEFTKRKELKNVRNFASSILSYRELWDIIYEYVDKKYNIDKIDYIFVSGDGAPGIKSYIDVFPNAIFVLDKYHYKNKALKVIFKNKSLMKIADSYIRNDMIDEFKNLVKIQIENNPLQEEAILKAENYIINNIEGIKNQMHEMYKCPCSMEGHVSNRYARYITSSPFAFSKEGLENKLKLLVIKANKETITYEEFLNLKYNTNEDLELVNHMKEITEIKVDIKNILKDHTDKTSFYLNAIKPRFDNDFNNIIFKQITSIKNSISIHKQLK